MFEPWIGRSWGQPGNAAHGIRLMVLGESHYAGGRPDLVGTTPPGWTTDAVETWALTEKHRFFTNITQLVAGRKKSDLTPEELRGVWDSILFYNYVPVIAATSPGVSVDPEMFRQGSAPFLSLLEEHRPEAILVCGHRLWGWVVGGPGGYRGHPSGISFHTIGGAVAGRMRHPGWAFSSTKERHILDELYRRARPEKGAEPA